MCACVSHTAYVEVRRQLLRIDSLSTMWISGIEVESSDLAANNFTAKPSCWRVHVCVCVSVLKVKNLKTFRQRKIV